MSYFDFHTHQIVSLGKGISNFRVGIDKELPQSYFSVGIHPWDIDSIYIPLALQQLADLLTHPRCLALGEIGLDKLCAISMDKQKLVLQQQIALLTADNTPDLLIIHSVKAMEEMIKEKKNSPDNLRWVLHAFNGSAAMAKQWQQQGFYLSVGASLMCATPKLISALQALHLDMLVCETDDSNYTIEEIYSALSLHLSVDNKKMMNRIYQNVSVLCGF